MSELVAFDQRRMALALADYLKTIGIGNRVEDRGGRHVILLEDAAQLPRAQEELKAFLANPGDARYWEASWQVGSLSERVQPVPGQSLRLQVRHWLLGSGVVTTTVLLICLAVFGAFVYSPDAVLGALRFPSSLEPAVVQGQWWRLLTPALLHFTWMHILFNLIWWRELGSLVERTQSGLQLLGVALMTALISNIGQFLSYGPDFGGLSAVVYGLLGYVWIYPRANPAIGFRLRPQFVWLMVGWLLLGYTGALDTLARGKVSNNGHLIGLIVGMVLGLAFGLLNRGKPGRPLQ